jgi:hypothetical protein
VVYVKPQLADKTGLDGIVARFDEEIDVKVQKIQSVCAPTRKGTVIGYVTYSTSDGQWLRQELVIADNISAVDFSWCLWKTLEVWFLKK